MKTKTPKIDTNILAMFNEQDRTTTKINQHFETVITNQNEMLKRIEQYDKQMYILKQKNRTKKIIYLSIFIGIFYYFNIWEVIINMYAYYYYILDITNQIQNIDKEGVHQAIGNFNDYLLFKKDLLKNNILEIKNNLDTSNQILDYYKKGIPPIEQEGVPNSSTPTKEYKPLTINPFKSEYFSDWWSKK